jgi:hypothetical protein
VDALLFVLAVALGFSLAAWRMVSRWDPRPDGSERGRYRGVHEYPGPPVGKHRRRLIP